MTVRSKEGAKVSFFGGAKKRIRLFIKRARTRLDALLKAPEHGGVAVQPAHNMNRPLFIALSITLAILTVSSLVFLFITLNKPDEMINVTLVCDSNTAHMRVWPQTAGTLLEECGISIGEDDELNFSLSDALSDGMELRVTRAFPVAVQSKGYISVLNVTGGTVGSALRTVGAVYDFDDELTHLPFEDLVPGMQIIHNDVNISYTTSNMTLTYREQTIKDDTMYKDLDPIIEQEGANGEKQVTQRITEKNGMVVGHEVVDQVVLSPAIDEIVRVGTKIHYQTNYKGEWREYRDKPVAGKNGWVEMTVYRATAYCSGTRTATGTKPNLGTIAVNPKLIPYGTQIWVKGYGYGKAVDTGAFRNYPAPRNNAIDLWFNSTGEARRWGSKYNMTILVKLG